MMVRGVGGIEEDLDAVAMEEAGGGGVAAGGAGIALRGAATERLKLNFDFGAACELSASCAALSSCKSSRSVTTS